MTVRVTTLKGVDAGAYYVEQLPNYYLDSGEPRGIWFGHGAHTLGLSGEVDDDAFLAVMAGMRPDDPDRYLGGRYNEKSARGFDVTASAPKSVSILFALGNPTVRGKVVAAHDRAVGAIVGWIEDHAHTRYRIGGQISTVDAEGIIAAQFRQHTSRALDPQLHTHVVIPNRVMSPDGRWLALDARLIKLDQRTLSALYHVTLRSELTASLGVRWEVPERGIAEIADVPEGLRAEFSTRTAGVLARVEEKLDRFVETMGREPTPRERWRLEREAAVDSRPAKPKAVDADQLHETWADQTRAFGLEPAQVVATAVGHVRRLNGISEHETASIITGALINISEKQSSWRPTELTRELAALVPTDLAWPAGRLVAWLGQLTEHVVQDLCVDISRPVGPNDVLRKDGRPVTESVADRALTVQSILDQEAMLIEWVDRRLRHDGFDNPNAPSQSALSLNPAQASAAAAVAGTDDVVFVVGPAGTGKTVALAPAVEQLRSEGRAVFGVAPSATAAEVLGAETGLSADTLDKLLIEHQLHRPPDHRYDLPAGATVIVDEAGMIPTQKLAELAALADVKGWRVALVGDPLQFSAVGRGGMFGLFVDTFGAVELEHVHRFVNEWERDASLRLRRGDVTVAEEYEAHGRLHGGTLTQMEREVVAAWWAHRRAGESVLLMTPTNDAVERLNQRCQQTRINAGDLDTSGRRLTVGPYTMHVGDEVATRRNDRHLLTDRHEMVKNRATWTIRQIGTDGSLTVTGTAGTVRLPSSYVADHVELAYARTGMGAQGRTERVGLTFYERASDVRNVYVPMSRGTHSNEAFIATTGSDTALDVFTQSIATDWIDQPAHSRRAELNGTELHRPGLLDGSELRELLEQRQPDRGWYEPDGHGAERGSARRRAVGIARVVHESPAVGRTVLLRSRCGSGGRQPNAPEQFDATAFCPWFTLIVSPNGVPIGRSKSQHHTSQGLRSMVDPSVYVARNVGDWSGRYSGTVIMKPPVGVSMARCRVRCPKPNSIATTSSAAIPQTEVNVRCGTEPVPASSVRARTGPRSSHARGGLDVANSAQLSQLLSLWAPMRHIPSAVWSSSTVLCHHPPLRSWWTTQAVAPWMVRSMSTTVGASGFSAANLSSSQLSPLTTESAIAPTSTVPVCQPEGVRCPRLQSPRHPIDRLNRTLWPRVPLRCRRHPRQRLNSHGDLMYLATPADRIARPKESVPAAGTRQTALNRRLMALGRRHRMRSR